MTSWRTFGVVAFAALFSPAVVAAHDFEMTELMALPDEIRHDVYLYILRNVMDISNPGAARLVQRTPGAKYFTVRLKYGGPAAATEDGPGLWVMCTYSEGKREQCSPMACSARREFRERPGACDCPPPSAQAPAVSNESVSNETTSIPHDSPDHEAGR